MKKIVLKVDLHDDKAKQKAMKTVATLPGIDSIAMEMKERKMTVIGAVDPINIVTKLRKNWPTTDIILVGPAKEPEKPPEKKEEGGKPDEGKKEEGKKDGDGEKKEEGGKKDGGDDAKKEGGDGEKKEEKKKEEGEKKPAFAAPMPIYYDPMLEMIKAQRAYNPYMYGHQPYVGHQPYGGHPYNYHPSAAAHHYVQNVEENPSGTCTIV